MCDNDIDIRGAEYYADHDEAKKTIVGFIYILTNPSFPQLCKNRICGRR